MTDDDEVDQKTFFRTPPICLKKGNAEEGQWKPPHEYRRTRLFIARQRGIHCQVSRRKQNVVRSCHGLNSIAQQLLQEFQGKDNQTWAALFARGLSSFQAALR